MVHTARSSGRRFSGSKSDCGLSTARRTAASSTGETVKEVTTTEKGVRTVERVQMWLSKTDHILLLI